MKKIHYEGGKGGSGVYQQIINQIPPHDLYIEGFAGGFAIGRYKRLAAASIAIDADAAVCSQLRTLGLPGLTVINGDTISLFRSIIADSGVAGQRIFVYLDPPYLFDVRSDQRPIYAHEFGRVDQHQALLDLIKSLKCKIAISGYWSELYALELDGWRTVSFNSVARSGDVRREFLWMNYPEPVALHDYSYLGSNFRERERIKRRITRWSARLQRMDVLERRAVLLAMEQAGFLQDRQI
jgi:site-specific DNA-adenine methylase